MNKLALAALLLLSFACERKAVVEAPKPVAPAPPAIEPDTDGDNLLNLAWGAAVVSRTGELNLETSAVQAIDGVFNTSWVSSPGAPDETLVYSLLAPSRITRVGITPLQGPEIPRKVAFDASMDGRKWHELTTVEPANENTRQLWPIQPTVARYIRIRSLEKERYYVRVRAFHALGDEVEPPATPPFTGCWTINGQRAQLVQEGARITGTIEADPPIHIDGGTDNRVALAVWQQGKTWGHAALTRTPDGAHLSGVRFYAVFATHHLADGWFGERCRGAVAASATRRPGAAAAPLLNPYPLYGLAFDREGRLNEELSAPMLDAVVPLLASSSQHIRIVSHELRYDTPEENRKQTAARIASLRGVLQKRGVNVDRIEFVSAGSDWKDPVIRSAIQRALASRVELSFGT